jgi:acyl dehydratase
MTDRYLEDFAVGQTFRSGRLQIDKERIKTFGAEFDPQPFHLDEEAARDTIFGGLAASGWHTAAVTMRLLVESDLKPAGGIVGAGFDEFRWPRPVRPGDELRIESEVLEVRASRSRLAREGVGDLGILLLEGCRAWWPQRDSNPCLRSATRFFNCFRQLWTVDSTPHSPRFKFGGCPDPARDDSSACREQAPVPLGTPTSAGIRGYGQDSPAAARAGVEREYSWSHH